MPDRYGEPNIRELEVPGIWTFVFKPRYRQDRSNLGGRCASPYGPFDYGASIAQIDDGGKSAAKILNDHLRPFLGNHGRRRVGVAGRDRRHDGGIDHPKTLDAVNAQARIHHGVWVC